MRHVDNGLNRTFEDDLSNFIQQKRKQDGCRKTKHELIKANKQCVRHDLIKLWIREQIDKMF
ncbi:hypothetical protein D3C84_1008170 [compost metagenome]